MLTDGDVRLPRAAGVQLTKIELMLWLSVLAISSLRAIQDSLRYSRGGQVRGAGRMRNLQLQANAQLEDQEREKEPDDGFRVHQARVHVIGPGENWPARLQLAQGQLEPE